MLTRIPLSAPRIVNEVGDMEAAGALALRTLLPAVVLWVVPTGDLMIRVATTRRALGVEYPMWLNIQEFVELASRQSVANSVFMIPVPSSAAGDTWNAAIANSTRFMTARSTLNNAG